MSEEVKSFIDKLLKTADAKKLPMLPVPKTADAADPKTSDAKTLRCRGDTRRCTPRDRVLLLSDES